MKTNHVGRRRVCAELLERMESPQETRITAENLKRDYSSTLKGSNFLFEDARTLLERRRKVVKLAEFRLFRACRFV